MGGGCYREWRRKSPPSNWFQSEQTRLVRMFEKAAKHATVFARLTLPLFNRLNVFKTMSQHRSLRGASTIAAKRNVLKRFERVELLKKRGQWKETSKVIGLPKTKPDV